MGQHLAKHPPVVQTANAAAPNWPGLQGALDPLLWIFFLTGAYANTPTLRPRVGYAPAPLPRHVTEGLLHQQSAAALAQAEVMLSGASAAHGATAAADTSASGEATADVRRVLDAVFAALPGDANRLDLERMSADDVAAAARTGRARGMAGVLALVDAGTYGHSLAGAEEAGAGSGGVPCVQGGLLRMADDVREAAGALRAAAKHACMPLAVASDGGARALGDAVEEALDAALADTGNGRDGAGADAGGDVQMADVEAAGEGDKTGGDSDGAVGRFRAIVAQADGSIREPSAAESGDGGGAGATAASSQQLEGLTRMAHMLVDSEMCAVSAFSTGECFPLVHVLMAGAKSHSLQARRPGSSTAAARGAPRAGGAC